MKEKKIIIAMSIGIFLCMLDTTVMNIALPAIQNSLGVSLKQLTWAINGYTIVFASLTIPISKFADLVGKRKVYLVSLILFGVASTICGLAPSLPILMVGRILQGMSAAILFPLSMIIGLSTCDVAERKKVIAILGVSQGFAAAIGPTVGGLITEYFGWHGVFLINLPLLVIGLVLCVSSFDLSAEKSESIRGQVDYIGSILCMIMMFFFTVYILQVTEWKWNSKLELSLLLVGCIALILFILNEKKHRHPMIPLNIFFNRQFTATVILVSVANILLLGLMVTIPTLLTAVYGYSELQAALIITPISAMIFVFSPISAMLIGKLNTRLVTFIGLALMAISYLVLGNFIIETKFQLEIVCALMGIGYGIIIGPVTVLAASDFIDQLLVASQSIIGVIRQVGIIIGVAVFVSLLTFKVNEYTAELKSEVIATNNLQYNGEQTVAAVYRKLDKSQINQLASIVTSDISEQFREVYAIAGYFAIGSLIIIFIFPQEKRVRSKNER